MKNTNLVIFGASTLASIAYAYFSQDSDYNVIAFTVDREYLKEDQFHGLPVVPFEEIEQLYPPNQYSLFIAISYNKINKVRAEKFMIAKECGYNLPTYINSRVRVWDGINIGENCFILENVVLEPYVSIGNNVTIWSGSVIAHHTIIEDHCFIVHGNIAGNVRVGAYSFIGGNATIRNGITVGAESIIGMGTLILKDVAPKSVYGAKGTTPSPFDSTRVQNILVKH